MATVRTVLGEISPDDLGITLSHEHLLLDTSHLFWNEPSPSDPPEIHTLAAAPVTTESSDDVAARPYLSKDNLRMTERDVAIRELLLYRDAGGKSFVDVSGRIPGWHPDDLVVASEATGVNIVASTGWYISPAHPPSHAEASVDELAEMLVKHIEVGIEGTDVRAGVIGELGMTEPLHPQEEKVLRAGGRAQARTGVPLTVHPMVFKKEAHQYIDILEAEGANLDKVYISHMDGSCPDYEYHESVMDRGVSIDYDLFGDTSWNDAHLLFGGDHWVSDHERRRNAGPPLRRRLQPANHARPGSVFENALGRLRRQRLRVCSHRDRSPTPRRRCHPRPDRRHAHRKPETNPRRLRPCRKARTTPRGDEPWPPSERSLARFLPMIPIPSDDPRVCLPHERIMTNSSDLFWEPPGQDDPPEIQALAHAPRHAREPRPR